MQALQWIVLILSVYQLGFHAVSSEEQRLKDDLDLQMQEKYLLNWIDYPWALEKLESQVKPDGPTAWWALDIINRTLDGAKRLFGGKLLPKFDEMKNKYGKLLSICRDAKMKCPDLFKELSSLSEQNPNLINLFKQCAYEQSARCSNEYNSFTLNSDAAEEATSEKSPVEKSSIDAEDDLFDNEIRDWPGWSFRD